MQSARVYVTSEHQVEVSGAHASNIAKHGAAGSWWLTCRPAPFFSVRIGTPTGLWFRISIPCMIPVRIILMTMKLETSKRTGIRNIQETDITDFSRAIYEKLDKQFSRAIPRTEFSPLYNCHGLTFASRRTRVE